jgi:hypothetical protein
MKNLKFLPMIAVFGVVSSVVCWSPVMGQNVTSQPAPPTLNTPMFPSYGVTFSNSKSARYNHEKAVRSLMLQYQKSDDSSEKADIRNKLVAAVNQQFDDRQAAREE